MKGIFLDFKSLHRILVPVDFSMTSNKAYFYAKELARSIGAEIHVVHVLNTHYLTGAVHIRIVPREAMVEKWRAGLLYSCTCGKANLMRKSLRRPKNWERT